MGLVKLAVNNANKFFRDMDREDARRLSAARTAVKVEAFRLMSGLKEEIRKGAPGGRRFSPLTEIGKRTRGSYLQGEAAQRLYSTARIGRSPLERLASGVGYNARVQGRSYVSQVGFVDRGSRGLSKSWKRIASLHQQGGTIPVTPELRRGLIRAGATMRKREGLKRTGGRSGAWVGQNHASRFFFLRKTTRMLKVPGRPILDPFWAKEEFKARRNIQLNFERKMMGQRI